MYSKKFTATLIFLAINQSMSSESTDCGKSNVIQGNIINGLNVVRGAFPWNVAIATIQDQFFCGGTLISEDQIISAAHCFHNKDSQHPFLARDIKVYAGLHNLTHLSEFGRLNLPVREIKLHPDWNPNSYSWDADIAVLILDIPVQFSRYIQPICLNFLDEVLSVEAGFVTGYGKSEHQTKIHEELPRFYHLPILNNAACFLANPALAAVSSSRTFCGGSGNGIGVCKGDSGSGLIVLYNNKFYLRGIVSSSQVNLQTTCDVNTFAIFTDVSFYKEWITTGELDPKPDLYTIRNVTIEKNEKVIKKVMGPKENLEDAAYVLNLLSKMLSFMSFG